MQARHIPTGTGYPHQNLSRGQQKALDRLRAPRFEFTRYWSTVEITDPDGKGAMFYPRARRTWAFNVKGYVVAQVSGRLQDSSVIPLWDPPPTRRQKLYRRFIQPRILDLQYRQDRNGR